MGREHPQVLASRADPGTNPLQTVRDRYTEIFSVGERRYS